MKAFRRFLLVATFAAVGIGLAGYVVVSTELPASTVKQPPDVGLSICTPDESPTQARMDELRGLSVATQRHGGASVTAASKKTTAGETLAPQATAQNVGFVAIRAEGQIAADRTLPSGSFKAPIALAMASSGPELVLSQPVDSVALADDPPPLHLPSPAPIGPEVIEPPPPQPQAEALPAIPSHARENVVRGAASSPASAAPSRRPVVKADGQGNGKLNIRIQNSDLREVLDLISEQGHLNILAGKEVQGKVSATLEGVDIESALDAILKSTGYTMRRQGKFIFVGTPDEFNNMEQALDRVGTRVFRPNYVTATELKTLLAPLLTERIGMVSVSSAAEAGIAANDSTVGGDKYAGGDVVLVRDYQAVLSQMDQVVTEVDIRPLEVSIEAMILSVKLNDINKFGIDFTALQNNLKVGYGTPPTSLAGMTFDQTGLKFGYFDGNVGSFVNALESVGDTDVIAKPRLMVLNKHRAEILIGDKKGYVSTTVTETSSTQTVDFLETGVQLRLRPFVSRDGIIRMEVHPELSDGDVKIAGNFTLPNKTVTEVTTNIMVRDGCTVVIGGLMKDQKTSTVQALPLLGSIPYAGVLFRNTTETTDRQELIVLITPRIVYEPATCKEAQHEQCLFERRQDVFTEQMMPIGRRSVGRRYMRMAQEAWEKNDRDTALRFAEMAVHFDPQNNDAIQLRSEIFQGTPAAATANGFPSSARLGGMGGANSPEVADWMLDDLNRAGPKPTVVAPLHPFDPGQPGTKTDILRPRQMP